MIQEKDFLYRVPVKNALVTAPGKQVRNPEILVDLEGGEFMHGDILDANSTNKLIDQSVKDAIDNSIENGNYVTNDGLHTALNQAIKEKADASALANEVTRATGVESNLQAAIDTKADATALSNYVLTTALNQQVDTLNAAISAKQDAGNYIPCNPEYSNLYLIDNPISMQYGNQGVTISSSFIAFGGEGISEATTLANNELYFTDFINSGVRTTYSLNGITSRQHNNCLATSDGTFKPISDFALKKETEQRFSKIEESISRMESTVNNFINSFNHAQGNSNTAQ